MNRTPDIRFDGFTDDWEQQKLAELVRLNGRIGFRGYTEKDIITREEGGVLTFSPTNIVDNKLTTNCRNTYITRFKYDESPEIKIHNGDILFVKTGSTLGKSALVEGLSEDATLNPQVIVMRTSKGDEKFISAVLITDNVLQQVNTAKIGGAVPTLTEAKIKNFEISAPCDKKEWHKIGAFFKQFDKTITLQQRKVEKLKQIKKVMLEKMFPKEGALEPELRFDGFTGDWKQLKFSDLAETRRGLTYKPSDIANDGIRLLRSSNIDEDLFVYEDNDVFVNQNAVNIPTVKMGDILITSANGSNRLVGKHAIINGLPNHSAVHGGFMLVASSENPEFTNALMGAPWYSKFISLHVAGGNGAIGNLNKNDLDMQNVLIPLEEKEQTSIGRFFASLDKTITLQQRKVEKLQQLKKALLAKMFVS